MGKVGRRGGEGSLGVRSGRGGGRVGVGLERGDAGDGGDGDGRSAGDVGRGDTRCDDVLALERSAVALSLRPETAVDIGGGFDDVVAEGTKLIFGGGEEATIGAPEMSGREGRISAGGVDDARGWEDGSVRREGHVRAERQEVVVGHGGDDGGEEAGAGMLLPGGRHGQELLLRVGKAHNLLL